MSLREKKKLVPIVALLILAIAILAVSLTDTELEPVEHELKINIEGEGTIYPGIGTFEYEEGEEVTLEAIPEEGYEFKSWKGDYTGTEKEVTIEITRDKEITAEFLEKLDGEAEETVERYMEAIDQGDLEKASKYLKEEKSGSLERISNGDREIIQEMSNQTETDTEILEEDINEKRTGATVRAEITWSHRDYSYTTEQSFNLVREQGEWKITEIEGIDII